MKNYNKISAIKIGDPEILTSLTMATTSLNSSTTNISTTKTETGKATNLSNVDIKEIKGIVIPKRLNVRKLPTKNSDVIFILNKDDIVTIRQVYDNSLNDDDIWTSILLIDDAYGYVMTEFLKEV